MEVMSVKHDSFSSKKHINLRSCEMVDKKHFWIYRIELKRCGKNDPVKYDLSNIY